MRANHAAHPFGLRVKAWMAQNSPDKKRGLLRGDIQPDHTVGRITQTTLKEVLIAGKECRLLQSVQRAYDIVIPDAQPCDFLPDHPAMNAPGAQEIALVQRDVLIRRFTPPV